MLLLGNALRSDVLVALPVVLPQAAGGDPPALHLLHRAVDVEHLQQQLERGAFDVDAGLERRGAERLVAELGEHRLRPFLAGHGCCGEVCPDRFVFRAGQKQDVSVVCRTAGTAHLLVVRDGGGWSAQMQHKPQVGLIETHSQRGRCHQRLDLVALERLLCFLPLGGVGLTGVCAHVVAGIPQ